MSMNILQRLNAIKKQINYIQKDRKVESYMAVSHDQVTALTRQHFIDAGVLVLPSEVSSQTITTTMTTGKGVPYVRFEGLYDVAFINIDDSKELVSVRVTAHALDHGDKAPGKALSYATKAAILKILQLETGEGDESRIPEAQVKEGMPESQFLDHSTAIDAATSTEDLSKVWKVIVNSCNQSGDKKAYDELKHQVSVKGAELKAAS